MRQEFGVKIVDNCGPFISVAEWAEGTIGDGKDITEDTHFSYEAARAVCNKLMREGNDLGKPIRVYVKKG